MHPNWGLLLDNTVWLVFGFVVGTVFGYAVRARQDAAKALEIAHHVEEIENMKNDQGSMRLDRGMFNSIAMAVVIVITAYSAFMSQVAVNRVAEQQDQRDLEIKCTSKILFGTVRALNERTEYTARQARSNVDLQKAQAKMISTFLNPPPGNDGRKTLAQYFTSLTEFLEVSAKTAGKAQEYPYPRPADYSECLSQARQ